jgi:GT2 family glycosyltransferase
MATDMVAARGTPDDAARRPAPAREAERRADDPHERLDAALERLRDAEVRLETESRRARDAERALAIIRASSSWRLTAPLRWLVGAARPARPAAGAAVAAEVVEAEPVDAKPVDAEPVDAKPAPPVETPPPEPVPTEPVPTEPGPTEPGPTEPGLGRDGGVAPAALAIRLGAADAARDRMAAVAARRPAPTDPGSAADAPAGYSIITWHAGPAASLARCAAGVAEAMAGHADPVEWIIAHDDPALEAEALTALLPVALRPRARVLRRPPCGGIAAGLNHAVRQAAHPWILFLSPDDIIAPEALARFDARRAGSPECRCLTAGADASDPDAGAATPAAGFGPDLTTDALLLARRDLFDQLGGFDGRFDGAHEYDFALRAAAAGPIARLDESLCARRRQADGGAGDRVAARARLGDAVRAAFLRRVLAAPPWHPAARPLPARPRGLCILRTRGTRLEMLAQAVASVREQAVPITPCVVVHGCAETRALVEEWLRERAAGPLVVLGADAPGRRRGYPCNVGIDHLRAHRDAHDVVCLLDDDDYLLPDFAERLVDALRISGADVAYCGTNAIGPAGEIWALHHPLPPAALFAGNFIPSNSFIARADALLDSGVRFDETMEYLEDWDFLAGLLAAGLRATPVFETLAEFRLIGDGNVAQRRDPEHFEACLRRARGRAAAAAATRPVALFWRDVLDFPTERRPPLTPGELALLGAARDLHAAAAAA